MKLAASPSLRALLAGSVDYAGLFPPAGLALGPVLENHAAYLHGDDGWMLGRLVLPSGKLIEAGPLLTGRFDSVHHLRISALGSKVLSASAFLENLRINLGELVRFGEGRGVETVIDQFEAPMPSGVLDFIQRSLWQATQLIEALVPWPLQAFWEIPFCDDLPAVLRCFAEHNKDVPHTARCRPFGVKFRTGGMEASAFPTCEQLAEALVAARDAGVTLKFTAGLHHPLRHFDNALGTRMHGFLNVFAAGILTREHRLDVAETRTILEDELAENFRFDDEGFAWRDRRVATAALAAHREFVTSFGSCSFDEPRDDLRHLGLML